MDVTPDLVSIKRRRLREYLRAEEAILAGAQSYSLDNRTLTRASLSEIRRAIDELIADIALEESIAKNGRTRRALLID